MRDRDGYYSGGGGGGVGVDLTVLWFYGVSPWPVALSRPLSPPAPLELTELKEPESSPWRWWNAGRANRGRPACASFPCIPSCPFRPPPRSLVPWSPLPFSLFLSVSSSPSPLSSLPLLTICLSSSLLLAPFALSHRHIAPHLYAFDVSSRSSPVSFILAYTRMTHVHHKRRFRLFARALPPPPPPPSPSPSPSIPLVPFFFLFQILMSPARAHTRIRGSFPFFLFFRAIPVSLAYARVHIYMCTHVRARDRCDTLSVSSSLSRARARPKPCANILAPPSEPNHPASSCSSTSFCFSSNTLL